MLNFELPKSAFTAYYYREFEQNKSKHLLMPLICLDLEELKISLFEDEAYRNRKYQSRFSINEKAP
jgi:hypothetical protein